MEKLAISTMPNHGTLAILLSIQPSWVTLNWKGYMTPEDRG